MISWEEQQTKLNICVVPESEISDNLLMAIERERMKLISNIAVRVLSNQDNRFKLPNNRVLAFE